MYTRRKKMYVVFFLSKKVTVAKINLLTMLVPQTLRYACYELLTSKSQVLLVLLLIIVCQCAKSAIISKNMVFSARITKKHVKYSSKF